mmetsp:Transcript_10945/g.15991  ORF Transcript_10945/g.15991 Transcript_10945/m.15991 type:complete len:207 (-) Transcript_10945:1241-1861(-)
MSTASLAITPTTELAPATSSGTGSFAEASDELPRISVFDSSRSSSCSSEETSSSGASIDVSSLSAGETSSSEALRSIVSVPPSCAALSADDVDPSMTAVPGALSTASSPITSTSMSSLSAFSTIDVSIVDDSLFADSSSTDEVSWRISSLSIASHPSSSLSAVSCSFSAASSSLATVIHSVGAGSCAIRSVSHSTSLLPLSLSCSD